MRRPVLITLALLALVAIAGVPILVTAQRQAARDELAAVLIRHAADGHGASFADLAAFAPTTDPGRQMRARGWMKKPIPSQAMDQPPAWIAWRLEDAALDAEALEGHEAFRPLAEELAGLLEPGDLCLTSMGWLPARPASATFSERVGGPIPNLLGSRAATRFFSVEAGLADDPTEALEDLDRLHASMDACGCLIDSMITIACDAMRDETYLVLGLAGALSDAQRGAWLAEAPRGPRVVADGLRGERLRFGAPLAQDLVDGESAADHIGQPTKSLDEYWAWRVRPYFDGPRDCATYLEGILMAELRVRGQAPDAAAQAAIDACVDLGQPFGMMFPNLVALTSTGSSGAESHVTLRAALVLADAVRAKGQNPADDAEAHAWVEASRPDLATGAWRYEPAGEDRIRVMQASGSAVPPRKGTPPAFIRHALGVEFRWK